MLLNVCYYEYKPGDVEYLHLRSNTYLLIPVQVLVTEILSQ